jgi:hypothetical protein
MWVVFGLSSCVVAWYISGIPSAKDHGAGPAFNRARMQGISAALSQFHATYNRWPTNLAELKTNRQGMVFLDGPFEDVYKRPFVYEPPKAGSSGRIGSFGADGRPGGTKADQDFFVKLR